MATSQPVATYTAYATLLGIRHELSVTVRDIGNCDEEALAGMTAHTIATWARVWLAVMRNDTGIAEYKGEVWPSACQQKEVANLPEFEPHITVWNKAWNNGGIGITVHSWDNGANALRAARAMFAGLIKMNEHFARFDIEKFEFLTTTPPKPVTPVTPGNPAHGTKPDKDDIDAWMNGGNEPDSLATKPSDYDNTGVQSPLPFRYFKQQAPNIITIQEFKKGGGGADEYKKMALLATLPYHKTTPQYDDNSMIYIPITGPLQIAEGQYGIQAIIPTEKGRVYVDMKNKDGQESPDWFNFSQDLGAHYSPLLNDEISQFFAPNCILVLRVGATKDGKQYKNYHKIYKPLKVAAKA